MSEFRDRRTSPLPNSRGRRTSRLPNSRGRRTSRLPNSRGRRTSRLPVEVYVVTAISFAVAVGFGVVTPVIALFASDFGVGATAAGAVISAFALMRLLSGPFAGRLSDRLGERRVLAAGLLVVAGSSLMAGMAGSYGQLIVLRGIGGVGSALFTVSAFALVYRVVPAEKRGRASGLVWGGFLLGGVLGPAFGGFLAELSLRAPFFVYAGTLAAAWFIALLLLPRPTARQREEHSAISTTSLSTALRSPAYRAALLTQFGTGWVLFGVRSAIVPLFVADALGLEARWIGLGFLLSSAAQGLLLWPAGRIVDRTGRRPAMVGGGALAAAAIMLLGTWQSTTGYVVSMVAYGIAAAFVGVGSSAVIGDVVGTRGGTVVAVSQMASDLGSILGPLAAGLIVESAGYTGAFAVSAAVVLAGVLASSVMPETRASTSSTATSRPSDLHIENA